MPGRCDCARWKIWIVPSDSSLSAAIVSQSVHLLKSCLNSVTLSIFLSSPKWYDPNPIYMAELISMIESIATISLWIYGNAGSIDRGCIKGCLHRSWMARCEAEASFIRVSFCLLESSFRLHFIEWAGEPGKISKPYLISMSIYIFLEPWNCKSFRIPETMWSSEQRTWERDLWHYQGWGKNGRFESEIEA